MIQTVDTVCPNSENIVDVPDIQRRSKFERRHETCL